MTFLELLSKFPRNGQLPKDVPEDDVHYFREDIDEKQRLTVDIFDGDIVAYKKWITSKPTIEMVISEDKKKKVGNGNNQITNWELMQLQLNDMEVQDGTEMVPINLWMQRLMSENIVKVRYTLAPRKKIMEVVDTMKKGRQEYGIHLLKDGPVKKHWGTFGVCPEISSDEPTTGPVYAFTTQKLLTFQQEYMATKAGLNFLPDEVSAHYKEVFKLGYTAGVRSVLDDVELIYSKLQHNASLHFELFYPAVKFELGDSWMSEMLWSFLVKGHGITLYGKTAKRAADLIDKAARDPKEIAQAYGAMAFLWSHVKDVKKYRVPNMVSFMPMIADVLRNHPKETMNDAFDLIDLCKNVLPCQYGLSDEMFQTYTALYELRFATLSNWTRKENCKFLVERDEVTKASEALSGLENYLVFKEAVAEAHVKHKKAVSARNAAAKEAKDATGKRHSEVTPAGGAQKKSRN